MGECVKTRAIVASAAPRGEQDLRLTLLTDAGKLTALAKGAKKSASKLAPVCQPFMTGEFMLEQSRAGLIVREVQIEESYYALRSDLTMLSCASWMSQTAATYLQPQTECTEALKLLRFGLVAVEQMQPLAMACAFVCKLMALEGLAPDLSATAYQTMSPGLRHTLQYVLTAPIEKTFHFKLEENLENAFFVFTRNYQCEDLGFSLSALSFLEEMIDKKG